MFDSLPAGRKIGFIKFISIGIARRRAAIRGWWSGALPYDLASSEADCEYSFSPHHIKKVRGNDMKIRLNENKEIVDMVKEGLKARGGYCPCRREMTEDTKCICKEFREQIADPEFEGYCHCMLYYKEK